MMTPEQGIRVVLVETSHPGNIGAVARAMKNMCLHRLHLVRPQQFPHAEATSRASGADDLLAHAQVCDSLDEALAGCSLVIGASARLRSIAWPLLDPRECADQVFAHLPEGEVALVFGREASGLTNEELERCHYLVHIPANPDYASLNVSAAVQVVCYELRMAARAERGEALPQDQRPLATSEELEGFMGHLEQTLIDLEFLDPAQKETMLRRLRRLFLRARMDRNEINLLRGALKAAQSKAAVGGKNTV